MSRRTAALVAAGTLAVGIAPAAAIAGPTLHHQAAQPSITSAATTTVAVSSSAHRAALPWTSVMMPHSVKGRTMTYHYSDAGYQYLARDGRRTFRLTESAGYRIQFGDGKQDGGDGLGGLTCLRSGRVAHFSDRTPNLTHRYAKAGTYTVKVTGYYCGRTGNDSRTVTYRVRVR